MFTRTALLARRYATRLPTDSPNLVVKKTDGSNLDANQIFNGKKVVMFGVPGAFTPVCSMKHVPSFLEKSAELRAQGVDSIICVSVNDHHVMRAWGENLKTEDKIQLVADPDGSFVKTIGVDMNIPPLGGIRSKRFAMLVDNGEVVLKNVEKSPGDFEVTGPDAILEHLKK
jgi:peroxiredoxin